MRPLVAGAGEVTVDVVAATHEHEVAAAVGLLLAGQCEEVVIVALHRGQGTACLGQAVPARGVHRGRGETEGQRSSCQEAEANLACSVHD